MKNKTLCHNEILNVFHWLANKKTAQVLRCGFFHIMMQENLLKTVKGFFDLRRVKGFGFSKMTV